MHWRPLLDTIIILHFLINVKPLLKSVEVNGVGPNAKAMGLLSNSFQRAMYAHQKPVLDRGPHPLLGRGDKTERSLNNLKFKNSTTDSRNVC